MLFLLPLFLLTLPPLDDLLDSTMLGKSLIQPSLLVLLGALFAHRTKYLNLREGTQRIVGLELFSFIVVFWTIPRSVDLSEVHWWMDQLHHLSMFCGGFLLYRSFPKLHPVVKSLYGMVMSSMLTTTGLVYTSKRTLLCSAYTLQDQVLYGKTVLVSGLALYAVVILMIMTRWGRGGP